MFQIKEGRLPLEGHFTDKSVYCITVLTLHSLIIHLLLGDLTKHSRGITSTSSLGLYFSLNKNGV